MSNFILQKGNLQFLNQDEKDIIVTSQFNENNIVINISSDTNENVFVKNIDAVNKTITIKKSSHESALINYIIF